MPKVTQLVGGRARIYIQISLNINAYTFHSVLM